MHTVEFIILPTPSAQRRFANNLLIFIAKTDFFPGPISGPIFKWIVAIIKSGLLVRSVIVKYNTQAFCLILAFVESSFPILLNAVLQT